MNRPPLQPVVMPGSVQRSAGNPTPAGNPAGGGERKYITSQLLARNAQSILAYTDVVGTFRIRNPSSRLRMQWAITFAPDTSEDATIPQTNPTWWTVQADGWVRLGPEAGGRLTRGSALFTSRPAPLFYPEPTPLEDAGDVAEVRGTITFPNTGTGVAPGNVWLTGSWEPKSPDESNEELQKLFAACSVQVAHSPTVNNGLP
jgi:hypothetical protein